MMRNLLLGLACLVAVGFGACSRDARIDHANTGFDPEAVGMAVSVQGDYEDGLITYAVGKRGGCYYLSGTGNRIYVSREKCR